MVALPLLLAALLVAAADQAVERQHVLDITAPDIDGGILSEITWDNGALLLQGVVANPDGSLSGRYLVVPAKGTTLAKLKDQTDASMAYWEQEVEAHESDRPRHDLEPAWTPRCRCTASRASSNGWAMRPTWAACSRRPCVRLGKLVLHERDSGVAPYDGEVWSWSPAELNRIAYVDGKGDLWVAAADGRDARRLLKGDFTLPAWSDDGKAIAVAEKKDGGRRWDISVVLLPEALRSPR